LEDPDPHDKLAAEQRLIAAQTRFEGSSPDEMRAFAGDIRRYRQTLEALNFRHRLVRGSLPRRRQLFGRLLLLLPLLPFYLLGVFTGYVPYKLPVWFSKRTFKDFMYFPAVNMTGAMFLFPVFWLLETLLVHIIWNSETITLAFALLMPFSCWLAFRYWLQLKKIWHEWRFIRFAERYPERLAELRKQYDRILRSTEQMLASYGCAGSKEW